MAWKTTPAIRRPGMPSNNPLAMENQAMKDMKMIQPLSEAPYDTPLAYQQATHASLARRLQGLGIEKGDLVTRMSEGENASSVRVKTPVGEAVLAAGMAAKIIIHHDDGHKTPVSEMQAGEEGHVEGLVCGPGLEKGLEKLGIRENTRITMLRRLPSMDYIVLKQGLRLILTDGQAAKIWGTSQGREMQLAVAGGGVPFEVTKLLGGMGATATFQQNDIAPGVMLQLESVRPVPRTTKGRGVEKLGVLQAQSGLRLYLRPDMEAAILVSV